MCFFNCFKNRNSCEETNKCRGGVDLYYTRETSGAITNTAASIILTRCQADIHVACKDLVACIGISATPQPSDNSYNEGELNKKQQRITAERNFEDHEPTCWWK